MEKKIIEILEKIRPMLQRDGGDVQFVSVDQEGAVQVKLQGACGNCPGSVMTIKMLIEKTLKQELPGIKSVVGI